MSEFQAETTDTLVGEQRPEPPAANHSAPMSSNSNLPPIDGDSTLRSLRARAEIQAIRHALQQTGWNRKQAAQLLKISYRGLLYKIRQHNITPAAEAS